METQLLNLNQIMIGFKMVERAFQLSKKSHRLMVVLMFIYIIIIVLMMKGV